jgi:UDP-glucose 4-epimerase
MRALVTGCAGFIGSHLSESLLQDGISVVGVDCFNDNYGRVQKRWNLETSLQRDEFDFVPLDLSRGDLDELIDEVDVIFHLAAEPGVRASWGSRFAAYQRNNIAATQLLLEAARRTPDKRFVYASSSSIYGEAEMMPTSEDVIPRPFSPYGVTKLAAEHLCHLYYANFGVNAVALRYFSVYGPRQRPDMGFRIFGECIIAGKPIVVFGDGTQTRDFTFVDDVVRATRLAASTANIAGETFNVGGGAQVSVNYALELLESIAGERLSVKRQSTVDGDVRNTCADGSRARAVLDFVPNVSIEDGLRAEFEWMVAGRTRVA